MGGQYSDIFHSYDSSSSPLWLLTHFSTVPIRTQIAHQVKPFLMVRPKMLKFDVIKFHWVEIFGGIAFYLLLWMAFSQIQYVSIESNTLASGSHHLCGMPLITEIIHSHLLPTGVRNASVSNGSSCNSKGCQLRNDRRSNRKISTGYCTYGKELRIDRALTQKFDSISLTRSDRSGYLTMRVGHAYAYTTIEFA